MQRILEPELMEDKAQADAYAAADFSAADALMLKAFAEYFPDTELAGTVLDLGCGPGNMSFQFAERFSNIRVVGVDGSAAMLQIAKQRKNSKSTLRERIHFLHGIIPQLVIPAGPYSAIVSNSFLHHLHRPEILWELIKQYASPGCKILLMDLFRPDTAQSAQRFIEQYAATEAQILQRDFYNSLLAALRPDEVKQQLLTAGLGELKVHEVSDRHMIIVGEKA